MFNAWLEGNCPEACYGKNVSNYFEFNASKTEFKPGGYLLRISSRGVKIESNGAEGMSYGIQTLKQLLWASFQENKKHIVLPMAVIQDAPVFSHRGLLLDCGRHFMDVKTVKKYIDALAYYKMNVLHWHLTEDQGWRIEIKKYPKLTEVGAWRYDQQLNKYGGFYTQEEIKDIVAYAEARHVTIIPEIELPGHSVAALASYSWLGCQDKSIPVETEWGVFKDIYCAGNDKTMQFLKNVMDEVCLLFPGKYIHIGGDEAPKFRWEHCDKCQKRMHDHNLKSEAELQTWFIEEIAKYLATKGKQIIGWDEILEGGIPADALIQSWRGMEGGMAAAKQKHGVIMSPTSHCYLDYPLESINLEKVYSFNPLPPQCTAEEMKYILGAEVNMWTERAPQEVVDSKVFPRILAMSEVLWNAPKNRNYELFYGKVKQQYTALQNLNIKYGFPDTPISIRSEVNKNHQVEVRVLTYSSDVQVNYKIPGMDAAMKWR
ncbi:MAG: beta-N-acetylhexosaminidase, partial [Bacteroidota bacterium]